MPRVVPAIQLRWNPTERRFKSALFIFSPQHDTCDRHMQSVDELCKPSPAAPRRAPLLSAAKGAVVGTLTFTQVMETLAANGDGQAGQAGDSLP